MEEVGDPPWTDGPVADPERDLKSQTRLGYGGMMVAAKRRRAIGRRLVPLAAAGLLIGLAGCELAPPDQDPEQNPGPMELSSPIEFLLVEEVADPPCPDDFVAGPEGQECFRLGDGMEITEVIELELGAENTPEGVESGQVMVNLTMTDDDGTAFADLTSDALATDTLRVVMVVGGEVVAAPQVAQQIEGGQLQISAWDGAREFVAEATGG